VTDTRNLLELAAKACGYPVVFLDEHGTTGVNGYFPMGHDEHGDVSEWWNPHTDDGDCLRMIAKLRIDVVWIALSDAVQCTHMGAGAKIESFTNHESPDAALRLCALRVAAMMGEQM
jgi:hypothetical protein